MSSGLLTILACLVASPYKLLLLFWEGYEIVPNGITMTVDMHGRTSGDAYVQFSSQEVAENAITEKHMKRIGHRLVGGRRMGGSGQRQEAVAKLVGPYREVG